MLFYVTYIYCINIRRSCAVFPLWHYTLFLHYNNIMCTYLYSAPPPKTKSPDIVLYKKINSDVTESIFFFGGGEGI